MTRSEYQLHVREKIYLDNMLDLCFDKGMLRRTAALQWKAEREAALVWAIGEVSASQ